MRAYRLTILNSGYRFTFFASDFIREKIHFLIKMAATIKEFILQLFLKTIIKRIKKRRIQRNNKRRYWVDPLNLRHGNMFTLIHFLHT